jgi:hypothetical protein
MGLKGNDYAKWSEQELRRAESVAGRFLRQNEEQIRESFETKVKTLGELVESLTQRDMTLDQRLDCFARIAEVSRALQQDAEGFFSLASEPVVARLLANVQGKRR